MSIDTCDGEPCVVWDRRKRRARKEHVCECCNETIERGHLYATHFMVYDGTQEFIKRCLRCEVIYDALEQKMRDEGTYGDEAPDPRLNCGHTYEEQWGVSPP